MTTFYFTDVIDNAVSLIKGGVVSGDNKADLVSQWPGTDASAQYGDSADLWGNTLLYSDVNLSTFGLALSVVNNAGIAQVDHAQLTVYYSLPSGGDNPSLLVATKVSSDRATVTPEVYNLPRFGLTLANDPNVALARDTASLFTPRYTAPGRLVLKTYRSLMLWVDMDPETNTPGLQVWASVDEGSQFQLGSEDGTGETIRTSGFHELFFPTDDAVSVGRWCQLEYRIPAKAGTEVVVACVIRDAQLRVTVQPLRVRAIPILLVLGGGEREDKSSMQRSIQQQIADLEDLQGKVVPFKNGRGIEGWGVVKSVTFKEVESKGTEYPKLVAQLMLREVRYA